MSPSKKKDLFSTSRIEGRGGAVWIRIGGFLSTKALNTQRTYKGIVEEWVKFLGGKVGTEIGGELILGASDLSIMAYIHWLKGRQGQTPRLSARSQTQEVVVRKGGAFVARDGTQETLTNSTINKKIAALRKIYRILVAARVGIEVNPFDSLMLSKPSLKGGQKRPTEMLLYEKVLEILKLPDKSTPQGLRDAVILGLLFGGGLRRSEVVNLRIGDIKKNSKGLHFLRLRATKKGEDADQPLPDWALEDLIKLKDYRLASGDGPGEYLLLNYRGRGGNPAGRLTDNGLYRIFKGYCTQVGLGREFSPHSARATAITRLLDKGFDHRSVQGFSRHSSVQMVEVYDKRRLTIEENPGLKLSYKDEL